MSKNPAEFEEITADEIEQQKEIEQKINEINKKLAHFQAISGSSSPMPSAGDQANMLENQEMPQELQEMDPEELPAIDRRGNIVYSNKILRENYYNQWPLIRYFELPYCANSIYQKVKFWTVMSLAGAYAWQAKRSVEARTGLMGVRMLPLFKNYLYIFGIGVSFSILESICFEDYCDVNSYHYQDDMDRKSMAQKIKSQFKKY
ncbi:hypothetical protein PPERSA_08737 [Pseudocohnilembus persalinus]|uniref:Uncharacterized protein n=1 Tax=Pseudocohnilembus persalinus TaxID=266149 RepID=A0A0V0QXY5_PSEPJ|nr:hypothetical protein PPERSA_08737 [Pseudocohnilembus persalinus]|eukprot:KRX07060.1 hypothetical protein PPERSA_08737 [Pseudocohnilembus persalinus]